jgi:ABC-2 type transport system permease protein
MALSAGLRYTGGVYRALIRLAFQRQLSYRTANLAGLATNCFWGLLRASVLIALFGARGEVAGYTVAGAVTYTGITQALISFVAIFGWWDIMRTIRSGEIATDLSRPYDFFWYWLSQDVGRGAAQLLLRGLPMMALYALAYRITLPPTPWHTLALTVSLTLALLISFAWRFLVSLSAFWTHDAIGVGRMAYTFSLFLSGFLMPIAFFPPWAAAAMRLTPFPSMVNTSVEIWIGVTPLAGLLPALAWQAFWAIALYALCRVVLNAAISKLVIQGG